MRKAGAAACLLSVGAVAAMAQGDVVSQRQALMKNNQENLRALLAVSRGQAPFEAAKVQVALQALEQNAQRVPALFPANSLGGETNALPVIAERKADFDGLAVKLQRDARSGQAATDQATLQPAFQAIGQTCNGCHETYRKKMP